MSNGEPIKWGEGDVSSYSIKVDRKKETYLCIYIQRGSENDLHSDRAGRQTSCKRKKG